MKNSSHYAELKNSALVFIAQNQSSQGGLASITTCQDKQTSHWTVFYPALISSLLLPFADNTHAQTILTKIANFIHIQPDHKNGYQYWAESDPNFQSRPYPPDLDTTVLGFIAKNKLTFSNGDDLVNIILLLIKQEQKPGGPYYTWFTDHEKPWSDIDPVVNATTHYFLHNTGIHLESLEKYLLNSLENNQWHSPYYASPWLTLFLIARSLSPEKKNAILRIATELNIRQPPQTNLDKACKVLIIDEYTSLNEETTPNSFTADPAVNEIIIPEKIEISGCTYLTAALWALVWHNAEQKNKKEYLNRRTTEDLDTIRDSVTQIVAKKISKLSPELRQRGLAALAAIMSKPVSQEILLLSTDISRALNKKIPTTLCALLGTANLFGWLAFTIYDECYDEGIVSPDLSLANICLRSSVNYYEQSAEILTVSSDLVHAIMDSIDEAHAEELAQTITFRAHFTNIKQWPGPAIRQIAERSFGHCLGPLLIIASYQKEQIQVYKKLFNHYLTARQLCDDLHDWPDDFSARRITNVTRSLFMASYSFPNTNQKQAKNIFWQEGLELHIKHAQQELYEARQIIKKLAWPNQLPTLLINSINTLEKSLHKAIEERVAMKSLIHHFSNYE